jgi:hypothetical protein
LIINLTKSQERRPMTAPDKSLELSGFGTFTGTPEQVRKSLDRVRAEQVIALTLKRGSAPAVRALAETVASIAPLVRAILERRQKEVIDSILEALVPEVPPPQHMLIEARMTAEARKAVLESGDWAPATEIARIAAQPNKWKKDRLIFAIRHRGVDYFPTYGLDSASGYRPVKALAKVLAAFDGRKDEWGLAYWFASVNSFLGGKRPQDLLSTDPEMVVAAAEDELSAVSHG